MRWLGVCLIASIVAPVLGPGAGVIYLSALGLAATALAIVLLPDQVPPWRRRHGTTASKL
jgi:hypothetical protein